MNSTIDKVVEPQPVYAALFGCILVLGLPLNAVSLWILLRRHSLKSPNAVLMVNLATSDLLLAISLPLRVYFYATGTWPLSSTACLSVQMLYNTNIRSSPIFITVISVDRLLAVVYPLRSRRIRTPSNAWKGAGLIWLIVLVMNVPKIVAFSTEFNNDTAPPCFVPRHEGPLTSPVAYFLIVFMFILLAVNVVCTAMVAWTLRNHLSDSAKVKNKLNVMLIFVLNLVIFTICFLPVSFVLVTASAQVRLPLICLAAVNCCLDPLLYYFSFDGFWKKKDDADLS